jgi:DNA-binding transcriptional MerR regulator
MRERLRIGEVAGLVGVTPKTVRHYEKIGLLPLPGRSDSGYRLYAAEDLLRLNRIKRLRSLGLSLAQIRSVLGCGEGEATLRKALEALRDDVEGKIERLEERRGRIEGMLAREDLESLPSPTFEKAVALFGDRLSGVSASALEQEKEIWATLDAFDWPEGYEEENERFLRYYAGRPEEHRALILIGERLAELADAPDGDTRIGAVARDLVRHFGRFPMPEGCLEGSMWSPEEPVGQAMLGLLLSGFSPAQRRVMALVEEYAGQEEGRDA